MSRSFRRYPLFCMVGGDKSLHDWKRSYNRALRRMVREAIRGRWPDESLVLPDLKEVGDPYDGPRDGSGWYEPYRPWNRWQSVGGVQASRFRHYKLVLMK